MIISHINEGMRLIQEINQDADFRALLAKSRPKTRDAFNELLLYGQSQEYKDLIVRIRNNIGFHYSANCVAKALKDWTKARPGEFQSVSMGTDRIDWDFAPGDTISQQVVVRDIFKIKPGGDDTKEADEIMDKIFKRATVFSDFCGHFVREVAPALTYLLAYSPPSMVVLFSDDHSLPSTGYSSSLRHDRPTSNVMCSAVRTSESL